ncbi:flagellin [Bacterioplanes sanyensis]|nr:flagellin [Bacterioplanes sanyensis]
MLSIQPGSFVRADNSSNSTLQPLASGKRINSAADDAAGLAIATRFSSQINATQQAVRNGLDAQSLIQTEDGALSGINDNLLRLKELAVQQGNGILSDSDRQLVAREAEQITAQIQETVAQSQFNGKPLFQAQDSASDFRFQLGSSEQDAVTLSANTLASDIEQTLAGLDFGSADGAAVLSGLGELQQQVTERRTELGAVSNRIDASIDNLRQQNESAQAARSRIEDADFAKVASERAREQFLQQAQISTQSQANANASDVLRLLS